MKSPTALRIAAATTALLFAGHMSGFPWTPEPAALLEAMKSQRFEVMGFARTYWDFYLGFGLLVGAYLALKAACLWLAARLLRNHAAEARAFMLVLFVVTLVAVALDFMYFFTAPLALDVATALFIGLAYALHTREVAAVRTRP